jgi:hypothetical protein
MDLSPYPEATSGTITQELPSTLWDTKVHYRIYKGPPLVLILSQTNVIYTTPFHLSKIRLSIIHQLRLGLLSDLFPSGFHSKELYAFLL